MRLLTTLSLITVALLQTFAAPASATVPLTPPAIPSIVGSIDDSAVVSLKGERLAALSAAIDRGAVVASQIISHMQMALKRPAGRQAALLSQCNAERGNRIGSVCVFNNVTASNTALPCLMGTPECHTNALSTAGIGVLYPNRRNASGPAYPARPGYSMATGLGSVNVTNLLAAY